MFTDAYAGQCVYAPSRCTLMTGLHTGHAPIRGNNKRPIDPHGVRHDMPLPAGYVTVAEVSITLYIKVFMRDLNKMS